MLQRLSISEPFDLQIGVAQWRQFRLEMDALPFVDFERFDLGDEIGPFSTDHLVGQILTRPRTDPSLLEHFDLLHTVWMSRPGEY